MCSPTSPPRFGLPWGLRWGRGRADPQPAGAQGCRAALETRRLPPVRSLGDVAPRAVAGPRAPLSEGDDVTALCRALPPAPGSPPSAPAVQPSAETAGDARKTGGGDTLASARPPHLGGVGWGCRPRLRGCPLRRAPSPSGRSSGTVRQLPPARGELRGPPCLGLGSGGDRAERARVSVTLRTKPFPKPAPPPEARRASRLPERTALLPQLCPGTRATGGKPREADGVGWAAGRKPLSPWAWAHLQEGPSPAVKEKVPRESGVREAPGSRLLSFSCQGPALVRRGVCVGGGGRSTRLTLRGKRFSRRWKSPVAFADNAAEI